jgi:hemerythrin-like domain-containing protein
MPEAYENTVAPCDAAIEEIRDEHHALGDVVRILQCMMHEIEQCYSSVDFQLIACMLNYIDTFPKYCHHPTEDEHLFKRLAARTTAVNDILGDLHWQRVLGEEAIAHMERTFVLYQGGAPDGAMYFSEAVDAYAALWESHCDIEENRVLPLAREHLHDDDWRAIDNAFRANDDPLFGPRTRQEFARLKSHIHNLLPAKLKHRADGESRAEG